MPTLNECIPEVQLAQPFAVTLRGACDSSWSKKTTSLKLRDDDVHVWRASLRLSRKQFVSLASTLESHEWDRANQFRQERDRFGFVASRGVLKDILSRYLGRNASTLRMYYGKNGKPMLKPRIGSATLHFNLSHSHGVAVIGVSRNLELGVDTEWIQPHLADEGSARSFLSAKELAVFQSLSGFPRVEFFFQHWTRKEALLKACGEGHRMQANKLPLLHRAGSCCSDGISKQHWFTVADFCPAAGFAGAVAVIGERWNSALLTWN
jgi:4'-phosphopantetheinyl transferase